MEKKTEEVKTPEEVKTNKKTRGPKKLTPEQKAAKKKEKAELEAKIKKQDLIERIMSGEDIFASNKEKINAAIEKIEDAIDELKQLI